jgi:hypothetical protein
MKLGLLRPFAVVVAVVALGSTLGCGGSDPAGFDDAAPSAQPTLREVRSFPEVTIHLTNTGPKPLYAVVDDGYKPVWLTVDALDIAPTLYNAACGDGTHDDPSFRAQRVDPGTSLTFVWGERTHGPAQVSPSGCPTPVPPGAYHARACAFTQVPVEANGALLAAAEPRTCVQATIEVPSAGSTVTTFAL